MNHSTWLRVPVSHAPVGPSLVVLVLPPPVAILNVQPRSTTEHQRVDFSDLWGQTARYVRGRYFWDFDAHWLSFLDMRPHFHPHLLSSSPASWRKRSISASPDDSQGKTASHLFGNGYESKLWHPTTQQLIYTYGPWVANHSFSVLDHFWILLL